MVRAEWDRRNPTHRALFARYLAPLVTASRCQDFESAEAAVYMLTLRGVPAEVLGRGVTRLLDAGVTWMPKPGDILAACHAVQAERRAAAAQTVRLLVEECPDCHGSGWADAEGPNAVIRCRCYQRALEALADAGPAVAVRALPAAVVTQEGAADGDA
jgi:hypothetical protein